MITAFGKKLVLRLFNIGRKIARYFILSISSQRGKEDGAQKSPKIWGQTRHFCHPQVHIHRIEQNERYEYGGDCLCGDQIQTH